MKKESKMTKLNLCEEVWGLILARGGSKSIPLKNMAQLCGRPLMDYTITAAQSTGTISRIFCSTDHEKIAHLCEKSGVEVQQRPDELASDDASSLDVIIYAIKTLIKQEPRVSGIFVLLEPTSPFLLPEHIEACVAKLQSDPEADSAQTIAPLPHLHHAYNQRYIEAGTVRFCFPDERVGKHNRQRKPTFYSHGNLRAFRTESILKNRDIYGRRSIPHIIPMLYAIDIDSHEDLELAEWFIKTGKVHLPKVGEDRDGKIWRLSGKEASPTRC